MFALKIQDSLNCICQLESIPLNELNREYFLDLIEWVEQILFRYLGLIKDRRVFYDLKNFNVWETRFHDVHENLRFQFLLRQAMTVMSS